MFTCLMCFIVIVSMTKLIESRSYNRSVIQKEHPGFGEEWIVVDVEDGEEIIGYFKEPEGSRDIEFSPNPEDVVTFTLFTRDNEDGILINLDNLSEYYNKTKPTKFVTHGWLSGGNKDTCKKIRDGFLYKYDANVIVMDWSEISKNPFYPIPMRATAKVGEFYGKFLMKLIDTGSDPKQFHLVGHSLGAHVSGFAARSIKNHRIGRITGLDPAQPGFNIGLVNGGHLIQSDAEFVDVIHTCAGYLGMKQAIGDADFYPNGGNPPQPGCENVLRMIEACSHGRSWRYFAESLMDSTPFMAYPCESLEQLHLGKCIENGVPMGDSVQATIHGDYYLITKNNEPYVVDPDLYIDNRI